MSCSAVNCPSRTTKEGVKDPDFSFHKFPKCPQIRMEWLKAVRRKNWEPTNNSRLCSKHFEDSCFITGLAIRKLKSDAVPTVFESYPKYYQPVVKKRKPPKRRDEIKLFTSSKRKRIEKRAVKMENICTPRNAISKNKKASAALRVCRICLCMEGRMHDMKDYQLNELYQILTDTECSEKDGLPQRLCWECAARLVSFSRLRTKALTSHHILTDMLQGKADLSMEDIKSVNRTHNDLNSDLVQKVLEPINCVTYDGDDVKPVCLHSNDNDNVKPDYLHNDDDFTPEYLDNDDDDNDVTLDYVNNDDDVKPVSLRDDENDVGIKDKSLEKSKEESPPSTLPEIQDDTSAQSINDETEEYYYVEYLECDDADDNAVMAAEVSEPVKKKSKVVKQSKENKQGKEENASKGIEKNLTVMDSKVYLDSAIARFKTSSERRKFKDTLDESLFDVVLSSYEEQTAEIQKRQETSAYKYAPYKCDLCFRGFRIRVQYEVHAARHSEKNGAFECTICRARFRSAGALKKHLTARHTETISCKKCDFVTRTRNSAREHQKWHAGAKYQCSRCSREFHNRSSYLGHMRIKHVSDFVCELCGYTFLNKKGIDLHKRLRHKIVESHVPLEGPHCSECDVTFVSEEAYSRHLKLSSKHVTDDHPNRMSNDSQYQLEVTEHQLEVTEHQLEVTEHQLEVTEHQLDGTQYQLDGTQGSPRIRRRQPDAVEPFACEQCGDLMRNAKVYAQHFRRFHPDKVRTQLRGKNATWMCEHCASILQSRALLKEHMWIHTGHRPFKCDHCGKRFVQKAALVNHVKIHSATRERYECPQCHKHFSNHSNRQRHMLGHTGLKPFKCAPCGKSFKSLSEQRSHADHVHLKKPWPKRTRGPRNKDAKQKTEIDNED